VSNLDLGPDTVTATPPEPSRPFRRKVIHGDPSLIAGRSWTHALYYFVLLAAAAIDVVTFHQVLLAAINETEVLLWVVVVGFTVVALALSHTAGQQTRQSLNPRYVLGARPTALLSLLGWMAMGVTALIFRLVYVSPVNSSAAMFVTDDPAVAAPLDAGASNQFASAMLFLAFFVGSGLVSGTAGFLRHDPAVRQYTIALARRTKAAKKEARTRSILAGATETQTALEQARLRHANDWANTQSQCVDTARRMKQEITLILLGQDGENLPARDRSDDDDYS
jgi:hypothetical protein